MTFLRKNNFLNSYNFNRYLKFKLFSTSDICIKNILTKKKFHNQSGINNDNEFIPVFKKSILYADRTCLKDKTAQYTYNDVYCGAKHLSKDIFQISSLGARISILCPNDITYLIAQWGSWFAGQITVPLNCNQPQNLLEYYIKDSGTSILITTEEYVPIADKISKKLGCKLIIINTKNLINDLNNYDINTEHNLSSDYYINANAMILYTSGTTGQPKGVVISHKNLNSQIKSLSNAWQMNENDVVLHVLPLNHVHGTINGLFLPLYNGGKVVMLPKFDSNIVWSLLLHVSTKSKDNVNVFMAVPTIYNLLLNEYNKAFSKNIRLCEYIKVHCLNKLRLMISGSAPLPLNIFHKWNEITGHNLLERYGMSEIGMALSNPYIQDKTRKRIPGTVGYPLPNVEVKIVDTKLNTSLYHMKGEFDKGVWSNSETPIYTGDEENKNCVNGELYVRGANVFSEYWKRPLETEKEFESGWFKTGDTVSYGPEGFKILGRTSVDIIKTGGHKVSALEIENKIRENHIIEDIAIIGIPDDTWGQRIGAIIVCNQTFEKSKFKEWCTKEMPNYCIPTVFKFVDAIPRNAMGKVNKKQLLLELFVNTK